MEDAKTEKCNPEDIKSKLNAVSLRIKKTNNAFKI
jgi:hypothetical protein